MLKAMYVPKFSHHNCYCIMFQKINLSRYSHNISREYFKFFEKLREIPKIGPKIMHNAPIRGIRAVKFFLALLTVTVIQKTCVQNFIKRYGEELSKKGKNTPKWIMKYLKIAPGRGRDVVKRFVQGGNSLSKTRNIYKRLKQLNGSLEIEEHQISKNTQKLGKNDSKQLTRGEQRVGKQFYAFGPPT